MQIKTIVDDKRARNLITEVRPDVEKAADDILDDVGESVRRSMVRQLFRQGSVSTGTGYQSLRVRKTGSGRRDLTGRAYLVGLDRGTQPHSPRRNFRLRFWASEEGWSVDSISQHIQRHGTRPHPFIERSVDRGVIKTDDIALTHITKHLED